MGTFTLSTSKSHWFILGRKSHMGTIFPHPPLVQWEFWLYMQDFTFIPTDSILSVLAIFPSSWHLLNLDPGLFSLWVLPLTFKSSPNLRNMVGTNTEYEQVLGWAPKPEIWLTEDRIHQKAQHPKGTFQSYFSPLLDVWSWASHSTSEPLVTHLENGKGKNTHFLGFFQGLNDVTYMKPIMWHLVPSKDSVKASCYSFFLF